MPNTSQSNLGTAPQRDVGKMSKRGEFRAAASIGIGPLVNTKIGCYYKCVVVMAWQTRGRYVAYTLIKENNTDN
jgi:hypothetical protein